MPDVCRIEGTQFKNCEDEEMQEQELKTLSNYYMDLRQVYSLIIFCPNNIYFTLACIKLIGYLLFLFDYPCPRIAGLLLQNLLGRLLSC